MPVPQTSTIYKCEVCNKPYDKPEKAAECESGHDIVMLPILRSDLRRLAAILVTYDPQYATNTLVSTIQKYNRLRGRA